MTPFETIINDYVQKIKGVTRVFFERLNIFHKFLLIARFNAGEIPNLSHNCLQRRESALGAFGGSFN